jgi:hypothetical protein
VQTVSTDGHWRGKKPQRKYYPVGKIRIQSKTVEILIGNGLVQFVLLVDIVRLDYPQGFVSSL